MKSLYGVICLMLFVFSDSMVAAEESSSVDKSGEAPEVTFHLRVPLRFADGREVKSITKSEIDGLRELRVSFGANVDIESVRLTNETDDEMKVRTCREYDAGLKRGYSPANNMERKLATGSRRETQTMNQLLKLLGMGL